jgi:UDP-N-acetyl-2-amino-2-deoxyglucuronate dehydrogenase
MESFAIIGCGESAEYHARQIVRRGDVLGAVCDIVARKASAFAARYGTRSYATIEELLAAEHNVTTVCICTPNGDHAEHAIKSLQAGKHVLCEAPLCLTGAAAWQLIETEKFSRRRLAVVDLLAGDKRYQLLHDDLQNRLGPIRSFELTLEAPTIEAVDWRRTAFPGGGLLYAIFPGEMSALAALFGPVQSASGTSAQPVETVVERSGSATLIYADGMTGTVGWALGERRSLQFTVETETGVIDMSERLASVAGNRAEMSDDRYEAVYQSLGETIRQGMKKPSAAFDGLRVVEAIETIYKAARPTPVKP